MLLQISDRRLLAAILPPHAVEGEGYNACIPRKYVGTELHHHLHQDGERCCAVSRTHRSLCPQLIVFRLSIILRTLGFPAVPLHGQLSQSQRLGALSKFKSGGRKVLVATDVASRYVQRLGCLIP